MFFGKPVLEFGPADISQLKEKMLQLPTSFWESDRVSRAKLAGNRSGDAVFFYNDFPPCVNRLTMMEAKSGKVSVLRYRDRPLFPEIEELIQTKIIPCMPDCDVMRVQLAELPPGGVIKPHRDMHILAMIHRMHIPIVTHEDVRFTIDGRRFFLEEGMLYELNNVVVHSVENKSSVNRVHLLVDLIPHSVAKTRFYDTEKAMVAACKG